MAADDEGHVEVGRLSRRSVTTPPKSNGHCSVAVGGKPSANAVRRRIGPACPITSTQGAGSGLRSCAAPKRASISCDTSCSHDAQRSATICALSP